MSNPLCRHWQAQSCRSCQWLELDYAAQLSQKSQDLTRLIAPFSAHATVLPPVASPLQAFRNKAKMVVSGSVEKPILGLLRDPNDPQSGVDLSDCPLYPTSLQQLFPLLKQFIGRAGLVPYNVAKKKGELKYILLTESRASGAVMLRFVLRSELKRPLIEREFPSLLAQLPVGSIVSLNIQPHHSAVLEGDTEIFLTEPQRVEEQFNQIPLFIRPQSFFQTNPAVAEALYATAQQWCAHLPIQRFWDLFCGVGGFGLHCAASDPTRALTGIEISPTAIASCTASAQRLGLGNVQFASLDSAQFALNSGEKPDLVIVNPPRRGIGEPLAQFLNQLGAPYLLYSSCNAETMAQDLAFLSDYRLEKVQLFDMFPHTAHYETLVLLAYQPG